MKRTTGSVNRKNFEDARKILYGPERWATGGEIKPEKVVTEQTFQLGPYRYHTNSGVSVDYARKYKQYMTVQIIGLGDVYIYDRFIILNPHTIEDFYVVGYELESGGTRDNWFTEGGNIYYNTTLSRRVNVSISGGRNPPIIKQTKPSDHAKLKELYQQSKYSTVKGNLTLYWEHMADVAGENPTMKICDIPRDEIKEGIIRVDDKTTLVIAIGFPGIQVHVATMAPLPGPYCEIGNIKFAQLERLQPFLDAVRWLMHVLTGPDPRMGKDVGDAQPKESSEPKPLETWFRIEKAVDGNYLLKKIQYVFFITDIEKSYAIRDSVLYFLHHIPNRSFVEMYALYMKNPNASIFNEIEYSPDKFLAALKRIKEYNEHEFLGCNICQTNAMFECKDCQNVYCNSECHQCDHLEGICP